MYCDYAATTPLSEEMKDYLLVVLNTFGNPSSRYSCGDEARKIVESTRKRVLEFINAPVDSQVFFTPSGSGSNTLAVNGFLTSPYHQNCMTLFSPLVHKSLKNIVEDRFDDEDIYTFSVDNNGHPLRHELEHYLDCAKDCHKRPFVVIEYANSEIGTIQPIKEIAEMVHERYGVIYVDCTGAIASVPIDVQELDVDMIGFSAHKLGALKGCGVLWVKDSILPLSPLVYGAQEGGFIGGTENVIGIASLGYAINTYHYDNFSWALRQSIFNKIDEYGWKLAGDRDCRLPNSFYFCIPGKNAEEIMIRLDMYHDIQVSTGSACSSGSKKPSSALKAIGVPEKDLFSYIRVSFHGDEEPTDALAVFDTIKEVADAL